MKNKRLLSAALLSVVAIGGITQTIPASAKTTNPHANVKAQVVPILELAPDYERETVRVDGEDMSYIQLGNTQSKKSIVIIHGSAYSAAAMIPYGQLYVNEGYNVILVDLPGHYGNVSTSAENFEQLGDKVAGLMNKLVEEKKLSNKSEVQGWSLGGSVALDIAVRHPEVISSVGMIDSSSNFGIDLGSVTEENKTEGTIANIQLLKSTAASQDVTDALKADLPNVIAPADAINSDFAIDKVLNLDDKLSTIKVSVYNFYEAEDMLTPLSKQNEMMAAIKHSKLHVEQGYNHFAVLENPQLVFDAFKSMQEQGRK